MNGEPRLDGTQLYCVLCNYLHDKVEAAHVVLEGTSLCAEHARDVLARAGYVWFWSDGSLSVKETIDRWNHA